MPVLLKKASGALMDLRTEFIMSKPAKILTLSFVGGYPETPEDLYKQIKEEIEPSATLETIQAQLAELAEEGHILVAMPPDGRTLYWRQ